MKKNETHCQAGRSELLRKSTNSLTGFSTIELLVVMFIVLTTAGFVVPGLMQSVYNTQLRNSASEVSDLMQQAKILSAKNNGTYPLRYQVVNGYQRVFIDFNNNGVLDGNEPVIALGNQVFAAAGAPSGSNGQPTPYKLTTDTSSGTPCDNTCTLAYSPRGLPCNYSTPPTCSTPAATYFVYYFTSSRTQGWAAVLVTKTGRSKSLSWNGNSWN